MLCLFLRGLWGGCTAFFVTGCAFLGFFWNGDVCIFFLRLILLCFLRQICCSNGLCGFLFWAVSAAKVFQKFFILPVFFFSIVQYKTPVILYSLFKAAKALFAALKKGASVFAVRKPWISYKGSDSEKTAASHDFTSESQSNRLFDVSFFLWINRCTCNGNEQKSYPKT